MNRETFHGHYYIGTSNIVLPVPNKTFFPEAYQDKSRLHYYASLFNSLEVNQSFYKIPRPATVAKWSADVPEHFRFTFKLWKEITHVRDLCYNHSDIDHFLQSVNKAGSTKGCLLVQFPSAISFAFWGKVYELLQVIKSASEPSGWRIAVEFRSNTWYRDDIFAWMDQERFALVQHDMPHSGIYFPDLDTDIVFLRFHGPKGDYRGGYTQIFLKEMAAHIMEWNESGKNVYAYFNNTLGDAVHNALYLRKLLAGAIVL